MSQREDRPHRGRKKGFYARQVEADAQRQGLTVEEYGVYKGDVGSAVKPINSSGGLLFLSILVTICMGAAIVFTVIGIAAGTQEVNWVVVALGGLLIVWLVPTMWAYYFKERKAARLRKQNGKTIELPTRRNSSRD
jgi:hypothetical protein